MRAGDTVEAPSYRNRFTYESPKLPVPAKPTEAGKDPEPWDKDVLTKLMLNRWDKDNGAMLHSELHRASTIIAADMATDLAGRVQAAAQAAADKEAKEAKEAKDKEAKGKEPAKGK